MKNKKLFFIFLTISILIFILIIALSLNNGDESSSQSSFFVDVIDKVLPPIIDKNGNDVIKSDWFMTFIRKLVGHYGLFLIYAIFVNLTFFQTKLKVYLELLFSFLVGLFTAILSELVQMIPQGRGPSPIDVLIDSSGYLTCILIFIIILVIIYQKKKKTKKVL